MGEAPASIDDRVIAIIAKQARRPIDQCSHDVQLAELGLGSLDIIEIIFALEETFDVEISFSTNDSTTAGLNTVANVIAAVLPLVHDQ